MPETKDFTLVVCPGCGLVYALGKRQIGFKCPGCGNTNRKIDDCHKLGLKLNEVTGEETWVGVKEE